MRHFVYTNIDHDGMLDGPDLDGGLMAARAAGAGSLILSGGIGELGRPAGARSAARGPDLESLDGVIVGKALYEQRFTVAEAQAALRR